MLSSGRLTTRTALFPVHTAHSCSLRAVTHPGQASDARSRQRRPILFLCGLSPTQGCSAVGTTPARPLAEAFSGVGVGRRGHYTSPPAAPSPLCAGVNLRTSIELREMTSSLNSSKQQDDICAESAFCKHIFQVFQMFHRYVASVLYRCCKSIYRDIAHVAMAIHVCFNCNVFLGGRRFLGGNPSPSA